MKNKTKGLLFIVGPIVFLALILATYAIMQFRILYVYDTPPMINPAATTTYVGELATSSVPSELDLGETDLRVTVARIINVLLGLLGMLAVLGIFIGLPFGIYFLTKKDEELTEGHLTALQQNPKYKDLTEEQITFIHKWSWSAFFVPLIWALANKMYLWALGTFVPIFNLYVWIKLSMDGRKMTWEQKNWTNFEQLKKRQKITAWIVVIFIILYIALSILDVGIQ